MPVKPTNRPGEWLTVFPLNEHQELMTLEDFQLLCPPEKPEEVGGEQGRQQSPSQELAATEIDQNPMDQLVHVHYHAAGFHFWASALARIDPGLLAKSRPPTRLTDGILGGSNKMVWMSAKKISAAP